MVFCKSQMFHRHLGNSAAAAKSLQSCPTLSDPMDCSPPGSSIHGIFRATVLEWGAIAFSSCHLCLYFSFSPLLFAFLLFTAICKASPDSHFALATPWTAAYQAPPSMGFSRQEYWSGVPLPSLVHVSILPQT